MLEQRKKFHCFVYSYRYKKMFFYRGITSKWERFIKSCVKKCYPRITRRLLRINCVPLHISRGKFPGNIENCSDNEDTGHRLNTSCPSPPIVPLTKINLFDSFISSKQRVINYSSLKLRIKTKSEVKLQKFIRRDKGSLFKKKKKKLAISQEATQMEGANDQTVCGNFAVSSRIVLKSSRQNRGGQSYYGTVTVANWMFRSTMEGRFKVYPAWSGSSPIRRGGRPPPETFPRLQLCVRIHPSGSGTTTRTRREHDGQA